MVLIELLIATTIAALLIAVVLAVYGSILNTVALQNSWREKTISGADALDALIRDLACAALPFGVTNRPFEAAFSADSEEVFRMDFYSAFPAESSNDWRGYSISQVRYSLRTTAGTDGFMLERECKPFRVSARNLLSSGLERWRGIRKFDIAFFDGSGWTNRWGRERGTNAIPQAAQIKLLAGQNDLREIGSEVFINVSKQIVPEKTK